MAGEIESLDTAENLERRRHRHWYDRLMMLTDGVFAIAFTLLAISLSPPDHWDGRWGPLWAWLAPQLDAYAMSALVISIYWLAHRRLMAMILTADAPVTVLCLIVLALIGLLPSATRLISNHGAVGAARLAYGALVVAIGLATAAMWGYAALVADLVSPEVPRRVRWFLLALMVFTPPVFLLLIMGLGVTPWPGENPLALAALFLIGWRLRLWFVRRLGGKPYIA